MSSSYARCLSKIPFIQKIVKNIFLIDSTYNLKYPKKKITFLKMCFFLSKNYSKMDKISYSIKIHAYGSEIAYGIMSPSITQSIEDMVEPELSGKLSGPWSNEIDAAYYCYISDRKPRLDVNDTILNQNLR